MNLVLALPAWLTACAVGYLLLGARLLTRSGESASAAPAMLFFVIAIWVQGGAIELHAVSLPATILARTAHIIGAAGLPLLLFVCFREYIGKELSAARIRLLAIVPFASVIVAATNPWHQLMWRAAPDGGSSSSSVWAGEVGSWFLYVHQPYSYVLIVAALMTLILHSNAVAPAHRRGIFLLFGATLAPLIVIVARDFDLAPKELPAVPVVFTVLLPMYVWLFIREQITEFTPLAYATVFQNMQDPVVVVDDRRRIIGMNHGAELMLKRCEQDALRATLESVFGADATEVYQALDTGLPQKLMTDSGRFLHLRVSPIVRSMATGNAMARSSRVLMFRDVSDVEKAQKEVQSSERLLRTVIDHSVNGILRLRRALDDDGGQVLRCIFANSAAAKYLGSTPEGLIGCSADEIAGIAATTAGEDDGIATDVVLRDCLRAADAGQVFDADLSFGEDDDALWLRVIGEPVGDDVALTLIDVTDRKARELQMESFAWSDPLTGVLNRRGFERDAARRLSESDDLATGALLFIDLNDFKAINDRYGHEVGDQLLVVAAERLRKGLRNCDIIGRPGGDEFVALVPDVKPAVAEGLARRLTESLGMPYLIGGESLSCAASIGLALYPEHANTLTGLLRAADQAMYRAKARCRGAATLKQSDLLEKAG